MTLQIGSLVLSPSNAVQFKSNNVADVAASTQEGASNAGSMRLTEASLRGLEQQSQRRDSRASASKLDAKSVAERSINYIQQRQSTQSRGQKERSKVGLNSEKRLSAVSANRSEMKARPNALLGEDGGSPGADGPYFHRRLLRSRGKRFGSNANKATDPLGDYGKNDANHTHLNQFLRD